MREDWKPGRFGECRIDSERIDCSFWVWFFYVIMGPKGGRMLLTEFLMRIDKLSTRLEWASWGFKIAVSCFSCWPFNECLRCFPWTYLWRPWRMAIPIYKLVIAEQELVLFNAPVGVCLCGYFRGYFHLELINLYSLGLVVFLMKILKRLLLLFLVMPLETVDEFSLCGSQRWDCGKWVF